MADVSASAVAALERMHPLRHDLNVPDYETSDAGDALGQHIRGFFAGHKIARRTWPLVPIETRIPGFFVYEIEPGPRFPGWTYVSSGYWRATAENGHGLEFVLSARNADQRHLELVSMAGYYHAGPKSQRLDVGHTCRATLWMTTWAPKGVTVGDDGRLGLDLWQEESVASPA